MPWINVQYGETDLTMKNFKAEELLADKTNTRKVLAKEVEELYGIIDNLKKESQNLKEELIHKQQKIFSHQDSIQEYNKQIKQLGSNRDFWKNECEQKDKEINVLNHVIVEHAKKQVGF